MTSSIGRPATSVVTSSACYNTPFTTKPPHCEVNSSPYTGVNSDPKFQSDCTTDLDRSKTLNINPNRTVNLIIGMYEFFKFFFFWYSAVVAGQ